MSTSSDDKENPLHRTVKWSPPYRRGNVEMTEFDLIEIERDAPIGRIIFNSPEKRYPLGDEGLVQIRGACLAGASELVEFCDLRVVADDAKIGWPVGRNWSLGNLQYIPWLVGMTKAKYYMFTSEPMSVLEAVQC